MRRLAAGLLLAAATATAAAAQAATSVAKLLTDGYEIKTAFADTSGGAYIILQRAPRPFCATARPGRPAKR